MLVDYPSQLLSSTPIYTTDTHGDTSVDLCTAMYTHGPRRLLGGALASMPGTVSLPPGPSDKKENRKKATAQSPTYLRNALRGICGYAEVDLIIFLTQAHEFKAFVTPLESPGRSEAQNRETKYVWQESWADGSSIHYWGHLHMGTDCLPWRV